MAVRSGAGLLTHHVRSRAGAESQISGVRVLPGVRSPRGQRDAAAHTVRDDIMRLIHRGLPVPKFSRVVGVSAALISVSCEEIGWDS